MMRGLLLSLTVSGCCLAACSSTPIELTGPRTVPSCTVAVELAFANPVNSFGKVLCGTVLAVHESSSVRLFYSPSGDIPTERRDVVLIPLGSVQATLQERIPEGSAAQIYVEGELSGDRACFERSDIMCLPFHRPFFIRVTAYALVGATQQVPRH